MIKTSGKTTAELLEMANAIESDPKNKGCGIWLYSAPARKKLDAIRLQIAHNAREAKITRGEIVNDAGYSGRQCNRR